MSQFKNNKLNKLKGVDFDAIVVGGGLSGLYAVHKLRNELGLHVQAYDYAGDVGGTWYWNRYPGAASDTESFVYRFSFDKELLQESTWKETYLSQPEILEYLENMADRYDLRRSYQFNTKITFSKYDEQRNLWEVTTDKGDTVTAKFLVTALGVVSTEYVPKFKGSETFLGEQYHTSRWPSGVDLKGKRVGVIGTGSTGVQLITATAPEVEHLTVFQRTPQYVVPAGRRPQSEAEIAEIKKNYDKIWEQVLSSGTAFGFEESTIEGTSVSKEEQERLFEENWNKGNGFRFMFGAFSDVATNLETNKAASDFIKKKISQIVKDPEVARKLLPTDFYAKRPICNDGYYETYNRENVTLVDAMENPIEEITAKGIKTTNGEYELDVIVYATGFDGVEGSIVRVDMRGRDGVTLKEKWADGPTSYLGMTSSDFPNFFMIYGPNGAFCNNPPMLQTQIEWISDTVKYMLENEIDTIEPKAEAENKWVDTCRTIADQTLFTKTRFWAFGHGIPGKAKAVRFYLGGLGNYREILEQERDGYTSFILESEIAKTL